MGEGPGNGRLGTTGEEVLRGAAQRSRGRLQERPMAPDRTFRPLSELEDPEALGQVLRHLSQIPMCAELGQTRPSSDSVVVGSTLLRDLFYRLTEITVQSWSRDRRVLDVSVANVLIDLSAGFVRLALREPSVAVIAGDDVDGAIVVDDEAALFARLDEWLLDDAARRLVGALRGVVRVGERHLWGNIAVMAADTLASMANDPTVQAEKDWDIFFGAHPDLAGQLEMITVPDVLDRRVTFAIRRNCCLRFKFPDVPMCLNCNLRPREEAIGMCAAYYVAQRSPSAFDPSAAVVEITNQAQPVLSTQGEDAGPPGR